MHSTDLVSGAFYPKVKNEIWGWHLMTMESSGERKNVFFLKSDFLYSAEILLKCS